MGVGFTTIFLAKKRGGRKGMMAGGRRIVRVSFVDPWIARTGTHADPKVAFAPDFRTSQAAEIIEPAGRCANLEKCARDVGRRRPSEKGYRELVCSMK